MKSSQIEKKSYNQGRLKVKIQAVLGYDGLDLRCFEITNEPHKNIKDNNFEAVKLDHCDQELAVVSYSYFGLIGLRHLLVNDVNNCKLLRLRTNNHNVLVAWYSIYVVSTLKFELHRVLRTDQRRKSKTPCSVLTIADKLVRA